MPRRTIRSPADPTPPPFSAREMARDPLLARWEENPLFVAMVRRRAYERRPLGGRRLPPAARLLVRSGLGLGILAAYLLFGVPGGLVAGALVAAAVLVLHSVARPDALPRSVHRAVLDKDCAPDIALAGAKGRVIAEALYLEGRHLDRWLAPNLHLLVLAIGGGLYYAAVAAPVPSARDFYPFAGIALAAFAVGRMAASRAQAWNSIDSEVVDAWAFAASMPGRLRWIAARYLRGIAMALAFVGAILAGQFLGTLLVDGDYRAPGDPGPRHAAAFALGATLAFWAVVRRDTARRRAVLLRRAVRQRADRAWEAYCALVLFDRDADAERWVRERWKADAPARRSRLPHSAPPPHESRP